MSRHRRPGYNAVIPYLVLEQPVEFLAFCREVVGMELVEDERDDAGALLHALLRLDDSTIEVSDARARRPVAVAMLHCYVDRMPQRFHAAVERGCEVLMPPTEMPYGESSCGLRDRWGVEWWLAECGSETAVGK